MNNLDRRIMNNLQGGFPLTARPYYDAAMKLGISEFTLIDRLKAMKKSGEINRFGPMYHAERLGGGLTLAAMCIPLYDMDRVASLVNAHKEVAHNYQREHIFSMWFVMATELPQLIEVVLKEIEYETGYKVFNMPKKEEFYIGLRFES